MMCHFAVALQQNFIFVLKLSMFIGSKQMLIFSYGLPFESILN